ncbi:MAG: MFS transporter [Caldilineaceae bacterium]
MATPTSSDSALPTTLHPKALFFAYTTVFLATMGIGIITPVLPELIAPLIGQTKTLAFVAGALNSAYAFCQFLAAPGLGALSDRLGRRPILLICLIGSAIGYLLFGIGGALWILFLGRIIDGITGGNISTIFAYVADVTAPEERGLYFGRLGAAAGLGFIFGPVIGGFTANLGYSAPLYIAAALTLANVLWGYFFMPESLVLARRSTAVKLAQLNPLVQLNKVIAVIDLRWLLLIMFLYFLPFAALQSNIAVFSKEVHGWAPQSISWLFLLIGLESVLVQGLFLKWILPKFGDVVVSIGGLSLLLTGYLLIALSVIMHLPVFLPIGMAAFGFGDAFSTPALNGLISRKAGPQNQGRVQGGNQSIQALAKVLGPLIGGQVYVLLGPAFLYLLGGMAIALAMLIVQQQVRQVESMADVLSQA